MLRYCGGAVGTSLRSPLSSRFFFGYAYKVAKKVMPSMSDTERAALNSGTVGFDGAIFNGDARLASLKKYRATLTREEQAFLDHEVEELCVMVAEEGDHAISERRDLPKHVWDYIREKGFLGMIIPKAYGGLGFSGHGHSMVVTKLASANIAAAVSVMVPNSLGPGELLMRYGTEEQKDYFLPRLASGKDIPCFALTAPASGSDAAAMRDVGVVCKKDGVLGVSVTFDKRYITLAPVASVVGLAFDLKDPDRLLPRGGKEGISIALLQRGHPGLEIGRRHDPMGLSFMNGPVQGKDVFVPLTSLLGGPERAGFGWNMLMECLAEGRAISLPALSVAAGKGSTAVVGAYARIRKQFKVPIAELEGVQEHLARIAGNTYAMNAAQALTNAMINEHEKPAVLSAVMKQQTTGRMRQVITDAMDILGGAGICRGPANYMAGNHTAIPIGITVEGANTLTRSLIIYGQGLMRSHPNLLDIVQSVELGTDQSGFRNAVTRLVGHATLNAGRSLARATFDRSYYVGVNELQIDYYASQLDRLAANFALVSDLSLTLGGSLKFREMLSGRLADALSNIYLGYATLWYRQQHKHLECKALVTYTMDSLLYDAQEALFGVFRNFPHRPVGWAMQGLTFPLGRSYKPPTDQATRDAANFITNDTEVRRMLYAGIYVPPKSTRTGLIMHTLPKAVEADKVLRELRKNAKRSPSAQEQKLIDEVEALREEIIQVDSFDTLGSETSAESRPALDDLDVHKGFQGLFPGSIPPASTAKEAAKKATAGDGPSNDGGVAAETSPAPAKKKERAPRKPRARKAVTDGEDPAPKKRGRKKKDADVA